MRALLGLAALTFLAPASARAAIMLIDDTRADELIGFFANDFELGLSIDGVPFQIGLNNPAVGAFPEADATGGPARHTFRGQWISLGLPLPPPQQVEFLEPSPLTPNVISDILFVQYSNDPTNGLATIDGYFISDASEAGLDPSLLIAGIPTIPWPETLGAYDFSAPFLTAQANSDLEATTGVPEAASIFVWGLGGGVAALAFAFRRRQD